MGLIWLCVVAGVVCLALLVELCKFIFGHKIKFEGKHVVITGGSSGLGLAVAQQLISQGANVTIMSRSLTKLQAAEKEIRKQLPSAATSNKPGKLVCVPCDVTNFEEVKTAFENANKFQGRACDILISSAGIAVPGHFMQQDIKVCKDQMDLNYFGSLHCVKAVVPDMIKNGEGSIVLVSSALALTGIFGYTQYSPTKFALRGLAECLRQELKPHNISTHIFYPANMATPGFEEEEKSKPEITRKIEGSASTQTAAQAASHFISHLKQGDYAITNDLMIELVRVGSNGLAPTRNVVIEFFVAPICVIAFFVHNLGISWTIRSNAKTSVQPTLTKKPKKQE